MNKTRALVVYAERATAPTGCHIYRGNMPMYFLNKSKNWEGQWVSLGDIWDDCQRTGMAGSDAFVNSADIFIFPRMYIDNEDSKMMYSSLFALLRAKGKKIVYECDDDMTNEFRYVVPGDAAMIANWADAITVSTPHLAARMKKVTNRPVYVIPNSIAPSTWRDGKIERPSGLDGKIVIGLTGSPTHEKDWDVLTLVLPNIIQLNPNVEILLMGYHPEYMKGLPQTKYMPPLEYPRYAQIIRMCDIILAPVDPHDRFNLSKSPIKVIEGMAAQRILNSKSVGAAVIATDNPVYRLAIKHEETGLLTDHTPVAWHMAIQRLLDDVTLRTKLQTNGFKWVYKHHNMESEWRQWAQAYQKILAAPANPLPLPYLHS